MSQANRIRQFTADRYIAPAVAAGRDEITIRAGDVHRVDGPDQRDASRVQCTRKPQVRRRQNYPELFGRPGKWRQRLFYI